MRKITPPGCYGVLDVISPDSITSSQIEASSSDYKNRPPPEEERLIIYESLPVYDFENNEFVGKVKIPVEVKLIDTS